MPTHQRIDARSLAMHRLAADVLRREPARFSKVHSTLARWLERGDANARAYLLQWRAVLDAGLEETLRLALEESERADALRQSSPLTIVLTNDERFRFLRQWRLQDEARGS